MLDAASGSIAYRFEARDLNLVLAPPPSGDPVGFTVLLDGRPPADDHGLDADESGEGTLAEPRMYQLVRQRAAIRQRTFEINSTAPASARTSSPSADSRDSVQARLRLTRQQILAFRRRVGGLEKRLPAGAESLRRAAWAGLQDSMPRAALSRCTRGSRGSSRRAGRIPPSRSCGDLASASTWSPSATSRCSRSAGIPPPPRAAGGPWRWPSGSIPNSTAGA